MEFRWVALITLWTMLIGPVLDLSAPKASPGHNQLVRKTKEGK